MSSYGSYLEEGASSIAGISDTGSLKGNAGMVSAAKRQSMQQVAKDRDNFLLSANIAVQRLEAMSASPQSYEVPPVEQTSDGLRIGQGASIVVATGYAQTLLGRMFDLSDHDHPELVQEAA